jgi:hypothetical protein
MEKIMDLTKLDKLALSPKEAMTMASLGRSSFYDAVKRGDIPSVRIGKKILIPVTPFLKMFGEDTSNK